MPNLKEETLEAFKLIDKSIEDIESYDIRYGYLSYNIIARGEKEFNIDDLDLNYNSIRNDNIGFQEICGSILFKDKTWLGRTRHMGEEMWSYSNKLYKPTFD